LFESIDTEHNIDYFDPNYLFNYLFMSCSAMSNKTQAKTFTPKTIVAA